MTSSPDAVTIHAAAAAGQADVVRRLLDADPDLVRAKGRDGGHLLHFAATVEVARIPVARGADVDARDDDHHSTPAQWRIGDAPEVARFLLERSAVLDPFPAVGLDDLDWVRRAVEADPACTGHRIGHNAGPYPGIGFQGTGGTILQWTLGFNRSPHEIAHERAQQEIYRNAAFDGHASLVQFLIDRGHPADVRDPDHRATPLAKRCRVPSSGRRAAPHPSSGRSRHRRPRPGIHSCTPSISGARGTSARRPR